MRLCSWIAAIFLFGLTFCIPYLVIFIGDKLFMYIQSQYYGYIYLYKIELFPYWFEEIMVIGAGVLLFLSLVGHGLWIWLGRFLVIIILLIWSIIVNTSFGMIESTGVVLQSPSTYWTILDYADSANG